MNYFINFQADGLYIEKKTLLVRSTSVGAYLIIFTYANRVDLDQAALTRAGSALFAKVLKGVSMR